MHHEGKNRYDRVLKLYMGPECKFNKEPDLLELLDGLWPAPLVTAQRRHDATQQDQLEPDMTPSRTINHNLWQDRAGEWTFNAVWHTYRNVTIFVCFAILVCQGAVLFIDVRRCFSQHWQALFSFVG